MDWCGGRLGLVAGDFHGWRRGLIKEGRHSFYILEQYNGKTIHGDECSLVTNIYRFTGIGIFLFNLMNIRASSANEYITAKCHLLVNIYIKCMTLRQTLLTEDLWQVL